MKKLNKSTLRWFIGTKSLMPIVEIRRRFGIDDDNVTVLEDEQGKLYVGLPQQAAEAMDDLRQQGKIGYELSMEFHARVLIGAFAILKKGQEQPQSDEESRSAVAENAA